MVVRRILVTRPEPGASATASRLAAEGFQPVKLPLTEIRSVPVSGLPDADMFDAVVATSGNALRHAPPQLLASLSGKPLFAVGERTGDLARDAGFSRVTAAAGDAVSLVATIRDTLPLTSRLAYLAGRLRTPGFEDKLASLGFALELIETYDAPPVDYDDGELEAALGGEPFFAALVYSTRGGELLAELARREPVESLLENALFFCISSRSAEAVREIASERIRVSAEPSEESLMGLIGAEG
ncbi:uroporphyrinogen-III synthase [Aquamicrobium sp. LC103]|uniref:uroporphyrinogen-III synthase n=1 Tax=Aquamicrobium sp. LC103 TaxID=1120658 RepID=UPI00063ECF54|nr:uroporphyrinogen-III synthase [Aquamicrobium sp. LC103]TKT82931.1 uroporphyrinogen-III synthase [Aquamicrobium sp. LC103]